MAKIKSCLDVFSCRSGQNVNFHKLVIIFNQNTPHSLKIRLANSVGINASNKKEKYLGITIVLSKDKKVACEEIIEKVKQRLQGWKKKTLSQVGRATLISSVASSLPSYQASSLILPYQICSKLDALLRGLTVKAFSKPRNRKKKKKKKTTTR
ncbi:putative ribonuclease h protein [Quercus suber]|uniref:Ribonuclease h protein n=1 Tax=Quercus suber TaxID=58331 RepID=A0AAW0KUM3_QUESU